MQPTGNNEPRLHRDTSTLATPSRRERLRANQPEEALPDEDADADYDYNGEEAVPSAAATLIGVVSIIAIIASAIYLVVKGIRMDALFIVLVSGAVFAWFGLGVAVMAHGLIQRQAGEVAYGFVTAASAIIVPYLLLIAGILSIATR